MEKWKEEMSAIQSDIGRERRATFTALPGIQPLLPTDLNQKKSQLQTIIDRYQNGVVPQMKKEGRNNLIFHSIYYALLTVFAVLSFLNVGTDVIALLGTIGLTVVGGGIDLPAMIKRIIQMVKHMPLLEKSVNYFNLELGLANDFETLDKLEETLEKISHKSLSDYKEFIKILIDIKEIEDNR